MGRYIVKPGEYLRPGRNDYICVRLKDYKELRELIQGIGEDHDLDGIEDYLDDLFGEVLDNE